MSHKQQLKPLAYKKPTVGVEQPKPPLSKQLSNKSQTAQSPSNPSKPVVKKPSVKQPAKAVKVQRTGQRSTKTIQHYECDDLEYELQDNHYFQSQLQKNIKTEILSRTGKPTAKAQIVLPKLQSDAKVRNMKDLQREMDDEMYKMMEGEHGSTLH